MCGGDGVCSAGDCLLYRVGAACMQLTCMACVESCCPGACGQVRGDDALIVGEDELVHDADGVQAIVDTA